MTRLKDGDFSADAYKRKLLPHEQMELVKRIAWFWRPLQITAFIKENYGKRINPETVVHYKNTSKWIPIIERFRDDYLRNLSEVPLANKRKRLDDLQELYEKAIDSQKWDEARNIIKDFRDEMEKRVGDISLSFTNITNEFHDMTDEQLIIEKQKTIDQLERIRRMKLLTEDKNGMGS